MWCRSSEEEAGSLRLAILSSSSSSSATASTSTSSTTDLLSWPADVPEGSIDAVADRVRLPSRPIALLSGGRNQKGKSEAVVAFADGSGRSVRSLRQGGGAAAAAALASTGNKKGGARPATTSAAFLACLNTDGTSVVSLVGAGVEGLSIRESTVDAASSPSSFPLPAALPAPAAAIASASEGRAVVLCRDGTLLAFDLASGTASMAWRHRLAAFSASSSSSAAAAPTTPGSKKRGKAASSASPPPDPALVAVDGGRSVVAVFQSSAAPSVVRAVAIDAALGAPRGVALVELPALPQSSSSSTSAIISASPVSADSSALVASSRGTAFVVAEDVFAAPAGVIGGGMREGNDLASLVGALANGSGGSGSSRRLAAGGVAAFDDEDNDDEGNKEAAKSKNGSSLPLLVQPTWAAALGKLSSAEEAEATAVATAAVAVPIPSLATTSSSSSSSFASLAPPAHFVAAAEALKKMETALLAASQSKAETPSNAAAAAAARSWAEAAAASSSLDDDNSSNATHLPPLPCDLHGRAASAAARLGHWDSVKAALAALPLTHGGSCAGLMPAAAAAGEFEVLADVAASAPDAPPADVADVISLALSPPQNKNLSAARRAWRDTLTAAAEDAVSAAEEAAAAADAAASRGNPAMRPVTAALAAEAAAAVAAVSSFEGEGSDDGELALHSLLAAPRDDAALQAALRAVPAGVAPALARYLAAWATALAPLPAVPARHPQQPPRHQQQRGKHHSRQHSHRRQQQQQQHPCGRLPTLCDVAAWASALVDAHLVALASSAAGGAGAGAKGGGDAEGTRRSLEALRAVAAERAADAAALAPLFGAAGHILCGSPLPSVAVVAAAAYSVEMLDLGVRR